MNDQILGLKTFFPHPLETILWFRGHTHSLLDLPYHAHLNLPNVGKNKNSNYVIIAYGTPTLFRVKPRPNLTLPLLLIKNFSLVIGHHNKHIFFLSKIS